MTFKFVFVVVFVITHYFTEPVEKLLNEFALLTLDCLFAIDCGWVEL